MFRSRRASNIATTTIAITVLAASIMTTNGLASANDSTVVTAAAPAATAENHQPPPPATPALLWADCGEGFQCASAQVPLDYDRPFGTAISLALIRLPAADPYQRKGSLFINPGGPGGSGVDAVRFQSEAFPQELRNQFDVIGFDPRGIMRSTPLRCFNTLDEAFAVFPPFAFPVTADEEQLQEKSDRLLGDACAARGGAIMDHMSTANVARDMDLLRQAVGDTRLNYLGFSYGSYLGLTYANLFPKNVGAFVIDGVLDPVAWSTGEGRQAQTQPFSTRLRSDQGASQTLGAFFRLCDRAQAECAFSGGSRARYDALAQRLLAQPLELEDEFGTYTFGYSDLVATTLGAMYSSRAWPSFAGFLAELDAASSLTAIRAAAAQFRAALGVTDVPAEDYPNFVEGFPGVACADSDNPLDYPAWPKAAAASDARFKYFGRPWTWASSPCQPWPGQDNDRYTGPWNHKTATPVLIVGNFFDPATRYQGAVTASRLLPGSRLLSYAGWGHTAFGSAGNPCIDTAIVNYLLTKQLPPRGTVCQPTGSPFSAPTAGDQSRLQTSSTLRAPLLPDSIRRVIAGG